jgi:hypothetical protein
MTQLINKNGEMKMVINGFKALFLANLDYGKDLDSKTIMERKIVLDGLFTRLENLFQSSMKRLEKECEDIKKIVYLIKRLILDSYEHKSDKEHITINRSTENKEYDVITASDSFSKIAKTLANTYTQKWLELQKADSPTIQENKATYEL